MHTFSAIRNSLQVSTAAPCGHMCQGTDRQARGCVAEHSGDYSVSLQKEMYLTDIIPLSHIGMAGGYVRTHPRFDCFLNLSFFLSEHGLGESPCYTCSPSLCPRYRRHGK